MVVGIQELSPVIVSKAGLCQDQQAATETAQDKQKGNFHRHYWHTKHMKLAAKTFLYNLAAGEILWINIIIVWLLAH